MEFDIRRAGEDNNEMYVEGVAVSFNKPTVLFSIGNLDYLEQVDSKAFELTDMTDVIFNYNHQGKVVARTRNKTLQLEVKTDGLHIKARLDGTEEGRKLYEEIQGGYIDRMSYAYSVIKDDYDEIRNMRTILQIGKLYDVSAVDQPAYESTNIHTRNSILDIEKEVKDRIKVKEEKRKRIMLLTEL